MSMKVFWRDQVKPEKVKYNGALHNYQELHIKTYLELQDPLYQDNDKPINPT